MSGSTPEEIFFEIFDPPQLRERPDLLKELRSMVNESFGKHFAAYFISDRLESDEAFADELMEKGFAVLVYSFQAAAKSRRLVATACVRQGKYADAVTMSKSISEALEGTRGDASYHASRPKDENREWEVKAGVVRYGEEFQKRGYLAKALGALENELIRRVKQLEEIDRGIEIDDEKEKDRIRLLACVHQDRNEGYWQRRGFTTYKSMLCPKGTWGSLAEFTIVYMEKYLEMLK